MRYLWWLCWYLWECLPTLVAFPIDAGVAAGTGESWSTYWELKWPRYAIGTLGFVAVALTLGGCLCCRRQRRPKGFQDDAGNGKEFKDGSAAATETTIERVPSASLELEVSRIAHSASGKIHFEALPADRPPESRATAKPKPPSPSLFEQAQTERSNFLREQPCREWFDPGNCHVPRERLKYLREIGRGWFGKVVEGTTESPSPTGPKNRGVVVRILTEEATAREKAWFLGEATPYLKLEHPNVLTLLGSCLEADPYLLLFESCPAGDLKEFLRGNRDKGTCEALRRENVPTRMALDIANALEHMHANGFAHTDLSARNCLVAPDLSAKLGDYGTGVEKYPGDYYVVGDRALPIRWSAPESLDCTETTIETRAITPRANLWSYAVLLWEMATWGERPYDDLGDEQVIEMIFSLKSDERARGACDALPRRLREEAEAPRSFREAIEASWKFRPDERATLRESKDILRGKGIEDFEKRWENLRPNGAGAERERDNRSASLQDLRGSVDSELWRSSANDERNPPPQAKFRLGPEEPVKSQPTAENSCQLNESGSETEEESWRGRVERGAYTEKVKQKSKSVADLMVLVHIDSDSDAEVSLGPQIGGEKTQKKRLPASGSDGDLRSHFLADEFDEAIRKLREPSMCNGGGAKTPRITCGEDAQLAEGVERPKLLTLTHQGQTPILRLNFGTSETEEPRIPREFDASTLVSSGEAETTSPGFSGENFAGVERVFSTETARLEGPVLRLVAKGDPEFPLLRYVPEKIAEPGKIAESSAFDDLLVYESADSGVAGFSSNFAASPRPEDAARIDDDALDVELWNDALAFELAKKSRDFEAHETIFDEALENAGKSASAPDTPKSVRFDAADEDSTRKNSADSKIHGRSDEDVNYSSSTPVTPGKRFSQPENTENRRKNSTDSKIHGRSDEDVNYHGILAAVSSSAPVTPGKRFSQPENAENRRKNDSDTKIYEKSDERVNYYRNVSSSAPETPGKRYSQPETAENRRENRSEPRIDDRSSGGANNDRILAAGSEATGEGFFEPSAAEDRRENRSETKIEDRTSGDANYRRNLALGSYSAPETPGKHYFEPEIEETSSQDGNYYENPSTGCSSAPETPRKHFYEPKIAKSSSKHASYYPDSLGSVSAPETPQFRGNRAAGQLDEDSSACEDLEASDRQLKGSAPDTPLSRGNYSVGNGDEDSSTGEELDAGERLIKRSSHELDDEEDRKHLSTPDDERSSDSGFRDKESCEEEESPVPGPPAAVAAPAMSSPLSASAEEEQMRILFELDTILDAEYYGSFRDSEGEVAAIPAKNRSISESLGSTESTDFAETVRANSCEPDFSDSRGSVREIGNSAESREEGKIEELRKLGEFLRREGEDDRNLAVETIGDDTEADFLADSVSESLKTDRNCSDFSAGLLGNLPKDSGDFYGRNDERSADSSAELRGLNVDSSSDGKFDGSNESTDLSLELRSSDGIEINRSGTTESGGDSPTRSERIGSDLEREIPKIDDSEVFDSEPKISSESTPRKTGSSEIFDSEPKISSESTSQSPRKIGSSDLKKSSQSTSQSPRKIGSSDLKKSSECKSNSSPLKSENSELAEDPTEFEGFVADCPEIREASVEFEKSPGDSPEKREKPRETSEKSETSVELEKSASLSFLNSERLQGTLEETSEKPRETVEKSSVEFERSTVNSSLGSENSSISPPKSEKPPEAPETSESPAEFEKSISASPQKIEKAHETPETCESPAEIEKSISASPEKIEKPAELKKSTGDSPEKIANPPLASPPEISAELENPSGSLAPRSSAGRREASEALEASQENSSSDSPQKTDQNPPSDLSMETRGPESVHSDAEQWSSRENLHNENDDGEEEEEEEDSSTMSLRSDNSYVSFGLDEEFVAAIRNELREKLPRAQMPVIEALDPRDEKQEPSINRETAETKRWEDEEADEGAERGSGGVDISIRYNVYGTPLSPILEERESAGTSESLISKDDDASIASRVSALSEDVLVVDTRTNRAMILDGCAAAAAAAAGNEEPANSQQDDDRDTSHGEFSDEENLEYPQNHLNRGMENKRICMVSSGAPLPSPEEESKWQQQFPLPLQMQDDLMSTSFGTDRDWDSQDEDEGEDEAEEGEEDEEENSSSSGEFVWKRYDESHGDLENVATRSPPNKPKSHEPEADLEEEDEGGDEEDEEEEEEFTPSAWDATLAPHRSALRSPEKTLKSGDQKKSVWFKKQRYHCVYEYPKETPVAEGQGQAATTWEPTSYADWEEMMDEPRLDVYPMEYDESNRAGDEEFYVSSSNRPFQFQSGEGKYVSQFFPGASSTLLQQQQPPQQQQQQPMAAPASEDNSQESQDEVDRGEAPDSPRLSRTNGNPRIPDVPETQQQNQQQTQLGELRHTRDRLKLNLLSTSGGTARADQDVVENIAENPPKSSDSLGATKIQRESGDSLGATKIQRESGDSLGATKIQRESGDSLGATKIQRESGDSLGATKIQRESGDSLGATKIQRESGDSLGATKIQRESGDSLGATKIQRESGDSLGATKIQRESGDSLGATKIQRESGDSLGATKIQRESGDSLGATKIQRESEDSLGATKIQRESGDSLGATKIQRESEDSLGATKKPEGEEISRHLAVEETPGVENHEKREARASGAIEAPLSDDLTVIQGNREVAPRETSTSELGVEGIVDIPKLETEESPAIVEEATIAATEKTASSVDPSES